MSCFLIPHPRAADAPWRRWSLTLLRGLAHLPVQARLALDQERPWLVDGAIRWLSAYLRPGMVGFEWGSGRSTLFFGRRCARLVSVEHTPKWHRKVRRRLRFHGLHAVEYLFVPEDASARPSPMRPEVWRRHGLTDRKPTFVAYADAILPLADASLDFVLVDGRARVECAANAAGKVKPGGILILDNSEWPKYAPIFDILGQWDRRCFGNGVWRTNIFIRPV